MNNIFYCEECGGKFENTDGSEMDDIDVIFAPDEMICPTCGKKMVYEVRAAKDWATEEIIEADTLFEFRCIDCGHWFKDNGVATEAKENGCPVCGGHFIDLQPRDEDLSEMTGMGSKISKLKTEYLMKLISLGGEAENVVELNEIVKEIAEAHISIFAGFSGPEWLWKGMFGNAIHMLENHITQWVDVSRDLNRNEWALPQTPEFDSGPIYQTDANTIITFDIGQRGYIECNRRDSIAED